MSSPGSNTGASQRASEITSAMLNIPGYADDSMFFMMRYGALAKETLRKVDWDEFQLRLSAMNAHWFKSHRETCTCSDTIATGSDDSIVDVGSRGTGEGDGANTAAVAPTIDSPIAYTATAASDDAVDPAAAPEPEQPELETDPEAAELKAHTLELIQDFPRLMRDFDRFVECTRIMAARYYKR